MKRVVFIILLTLTVISCGKKGSLEYPSQESHIVNKLESYLA